MRRRNVLIAGASVAMGLSQPCIAAGEPEWKPTRPIKWVHPAAPGGASDVLARLIMDRLGQRLGQPVVIEYRPGAGSAIAAEYVMQQPPDGHALFFTTTTFNLNPLINRTRYDPLKDFTQLILVADINMVLAANASGRRFRSPQELVAWARQNPGQAFVALPNKGGTGELIVSLINLATGAKLQPVIYKGGAPMMTDVLGGQVPLAVESMATFGEYVKSGQIVPIVASGKRHLPGYPQVPTLNETIVPGADINAWFALQMPPGVPPRIVARLNREINEIIRDPQVIEGFARGGATMVGGTPQAAAETIAARTEVFRKIINDAHIKAE